MMGVTFPYTECELSAVKAERDRLAAKVARLKAERDAFRRNLRDTFDAMCAMRNSINEYLPMPSLESDLLQGPENSVFCAAVAEAVVSALTVARAERDAAMAGRVKVKPLAWENFDAWTYWATSAVGTYRVQERNGVWKATIHRKDNDDLIYEYTTDGLTPNDFEAAQIAAQADYEARILAALQPDIERAEPVVGALFVDQDGDVCINDGRRDNLVFCPAADENGKPLCPDVVDEIIRRFNAIRSDTTPAPQAREITVHDAAEVPEVEALMVAAHKMLHDIGELVANSEGVAGLHMNGDVADWESLLPGGSFGAWFHGVEVLRTALAAMQKGG